MDRVRNERKSGGETANRNEREGKNVLGRKGKWQTKMGRV
jgi:hypothetical protein